MTNAQHQSDITLAVLDLNKDARRLAAKKVRDFLDNLLKFRQFQSSPNFQRSVSQEEFEAYKRMAENFEELPSYCAQFGDDLYEQGIEMGGYMGLMIRIRGQDSEFIVKEYLRRETVGKGQPGQIIPYGLLPTEMKMSAEKKDKLVFYRGMRMALEESIQPSMETPTVVEPKPIVPTPEPLVFAPDATARSKVETLVDSLVGLNINSNKQEASSLESPNCCPKTAAFKELPRYCAQPEDTINDLFEKGAVMANEMADIITSRPGSEKLVKDYLEEATIGKGFYMQEIPFGLLKEELTLWAPEQQELAFYRGMQNELQNMKKQSVKEATIAAPDPIHPKAREYLETIVQTLVKLNTSSSYTSPDDRLQVYDHLRVSIAFDKLPRLQAQPSDTLNDFLERGKSMAADMADVVAAHPKSENFVKDYLKKETTGLGIYGQEVDNGLLEEERELPKLKQQQLVFYRGMRKELQRLSKLKSTQ